MTSAAEKLVRTSRARASFLRPYFTAAIFALVLVESEVVPTMSVDQYRRLYFNPKWIVQYSVEELSTIILHEVGHVLRDHQVRAKSLGITRLTAADANWAQDCELNDDLRDEAASLRDIHPLPEPKDPESLALPEELRGPALPWKINCEDGKAWEAYYRSMQEQQREEEDPSDGNEPMPCRMLDGDCGSGAHGVPRDWELGDPGETGAEAVMDADWKDIQDITARAIVDHAKRIGHVSGSWVEWSKALLKPPMIPWDQILSSHMRWAINDVLGMVFHSYKRPSRRQSAFPDFVMPSMRKPIPFVCIVGDTSGSMDKERLAYVRGVIRQIGRSLGARLAFLATDTDVKGGVQYVHDGPDVELRGRGGTDMRVGIEYALKELHPKPDVIVVCSDCETEWPASAPAVRTIVCAVGASDHWISKVPKWATVVEVPLQNTKRQHETNH